jgi:hypothetical protein
MFQRGLRKDDVLAVVRAGEGVDDYPDDSPYPSRLLLAFVRGKPVHVVLAYDVESETAIVVTAYEPSAELWGDDFRTRRQS